MTIVRINAIAYGQESPANISVEARYLYSAREVLAGEATTPDFFEVSLPDTGVCLSINASVAERLAHAILTAVAERRRDLDAARGPAAVAAELTEVA